MLKNHFLLALRHLQRNKLYTFINVFGLAIGIAACLVITLIVQFELSFDDFRQDRDRIYRVYTEFTGVFEGTNRGVATAVPTWMETNVTGIAHQAQFFTKSMEVSPLNAQQKAMDKSMQKDIVVVKPGYFSVFSDYQWISGDPESALSRPNQVVLSDAKALQYFGEANPANALGRQLIYGDSTVLTVSGIVAAPPKTSDLYFNDFISFATIESSDWKNDFTLDDLNSTNSNAQFFIKLLPDKDPEAISAQLAPLEEKYAAENQEYGFVAHYRLQPFLQLHFNGELGIFDSSRSPAHLSTLYILIGVALLLLIVAAINFINLETAQSIRRAKEVGVRKVMGGSRGVLIGQFLGQTFLVASLAMILAVFLIRISFWYFSDFIPAELVFDPFNPLMLLFFAGTTVVVAVLAGTYPAFVLSAFRPALALKDRIGALGKSGGSQNLRRGLVVFQFIIAQVLIFGTIAVGYQIRYLMQKDMGFNREAVVYFSTSYRDTTSRRYSLGEELLRMPEVKSLSFHQAPPAFNGWSTSVMKLRKGEEELSVDVHRKFGDTAFIHLYDIDLLAGRNLLPSDTVKEMLINLTFAHQMGYQQPEEAIGQTAEFNGKSVPIVGVVADFNVRSLHNPLVPVAIANERSNFRTISLKLDQHLEKGAGLDAAIQKLEEKWKTFYPDQPFNYHFLDETVANFYLSEQRTAKLVRTATLVAILISCLGLFGLVSFAANQRTKEIGIRKVLGATVSGIVALLSKEFVWLILIAFVVAVPLAWYSATQWLSDFAYAIQLSWWLFALCGGLALLVAFVTMSIQAIRAARNNPVESLRSE